MRLTALQSTDYTIRGHLLELREGRDIDVPHDLGVLLIERGFARQPDEEGPPPEHADEDGGAEPDELDEFLDRTVDEIAADVPEIELTEDLDELEEREKQRDPKPRKGVLEAIQARRADLAEE